MDSVDEVLESLATQRYVAERSVGGDLRVLAATLLVPFRRAA